MRRLSDALKHNPAIYITQIDMNYLSILRTRPVIYIVEYNFIVETIIGVDIAKDECEQFQITPITSLQKQWGSVIILCYLFIYILILLLMIYERYGSLMLKFGIGCREDWLHKLLTHRVYAALMR